MKKLFLISFLVFYNPVLAAPSGEQLLNACEMALSEGFDSEIGMSCIWYVTPCDCNFGTKKEIPRVCLPYDEPHEKLIELVIDGLKKQPELLNMTAEMAANTILSVTYPCRD